MPAVFETEDMSRDEKWNKNFNKGFKEAVFRGRVCGKLLISESFFKVFIFDVAVHILGQNIAVVDSHALVGRVVRCFDSRSKNFKAVFA